MTRRKLLGTFLAASTAAAYPCYYEPRRLEVVRSRVKFAGKTTAAPVRVAHVSDLHASIFVSTSLIEHAVALALAEKPDIVCLTGDYITLRGGFDPSRYVNILRRLSDAAPTFAVLGNHDGGPWAREHAGFGDHLLVERILAESRIELLHNRSAAVDVRGRRIRLVGVGDLWTEEMEARRAFAGVDGRDRTILLAHNPDTKDEVSRYWWDLMLSGHTHGGQVIVPMFGVAFAPVYDKRYVSGLKAWGERQINVSRGVGNYAGVRFRCRPDVSILSVE